jgi:hypothetical protein
MTLPTELPTHIAFHAASIEWGHTDCVSHEPLSHTNTIHTRNVTPCIYLVMGDVSGLSAPGLHNAERRLVGIQDEEIAN